MSFRTSRRGAAALVTFAIAAAGVVAAVPAHAATAPPWDPDSNATGTVKFYDAAGNVITSGTNTDGATGPFAAYASGSVYPKAGDTKAEIVFAQPDPNTPNSQNWYAEAAGVYTTNPVTDTSVPANLRTVSQTAPIVKSGSGDQTLEGFQSDAQQPTAAGYVNMIQVRIVTATSAGTVHPSVYDTADIMVNPTAHTWQQVYPTPMAPPGAPTAVTATAGNASATVSWTAPTSAGSSAITGYDVKYSADGGTTWTSVTRTGTATTQSVTGLTNGTSYVFEVAAINSVGESAFAQSNAVTPVAPTSVPGVPTAVTATAGNASANVSWTAPASAGSSPITGYDVRYSADGGTTFTAVTRSGTATTQSVTGLTNGTSYVFEVAAINSVGESAFARSNAVTPVVPAAPGVPTAVTATAGNASATVSWTAPASAGSSPITGYDVKYSADDGATWTSVTRTGTATTQSVTGLTNGTSYVFEVAAINSVGESAFAESNAVTPAAPVVDNSSLSISATKVKTYGQPTTVSGTLTDTTLGKPAVGYKLYLQSHPTTSSTWTTIASGTTNSAGTVTLTLKPSATTLYHWVYTGSVKTLKAATSAQAGTTINQYLYSYATHTVLKSGQTLSIWGSLAPSRSNAKIYLQELSGSTWKTLAISGVIKNQKLPNGKTGVGYVLSIRIYTRASYQFRAYVPATTTIAAGYSAAHALKVS